jgi:hypothetical protein
LLLSDLKQSMEKALGRKIDLIHGPLKSNARIHPERIVSLYER